MSLATPAQVLERLEAIEADLAAVSNEYEDAAMAWFRAKKVREQRHAEATLSFKEGTVAEKKARADLTLAEDDIGLVEEARYEGLKGRVKVLETRAAIGMSILRSQGRT